MKIKTVLFSLFLLVSSPVFAAPEGTLDVDNFLRTVDLTKIIHTNNAVNLAAQMSDPNTNTTNINDMTDFLALASKSTGLIDTFIAEFDSQSNILARQSYTSPWVGVGKFTQAEIPAVKLQDGFQSVKSCIVRKSKLPVAPQNIHRVVIFKALQTGQMIYDYVFALPNLESGTCQEILYTPDTDDCAMGMVVNCHATVKI